MKKLLLVVLVPVVLAVGVALLLSHGTGGGGKPEVLVLCGGSMRAALEEIVERYEAVSDDTVLVTYGGSGEFCAQLQQTRKGDIFVCHDPFMPWAEKQGLIKEWKTVGHLELVIIVPGGNPKGIMGFEDLARPGLRLGVGDRRYSTSGVIVDEMLKKADFGEAMRENIRMESKGHQQRATDVTLGHLDASIIWKPVALLFRDRLDIIPISGEHRVDAVTSATYRESDLGNVRVTVGITAYTGNEEHARGFYEFATTEGADVFREHGFTR